MQLINSKFMCHSSFHQRHFFLLFTNFFLFFSNTYSQSTPPVPTTRKYETVEVDLNSKTFKNSLLFDEPFNITGNLNADKEVIEVQFNYRIKNRKKWQYWPSPDLINKPFDRKDKAYDDKRSGFLTEPIKWQRINNDENNFLVRCGALHPNTIYQFRFKTKKRFNLTDDEKKALRNKIAETVIAYFKSKKTINQASQDTLFDEMVTYINGAKKDKFEILELPDNAPFDLKDKVSRQRLSKFFGIADLSNFKMEEFQNNLKNIISDLDRGLGKNKFNENLVGKIGEVINGISNLDKKSQLLLSLPVDRSIDEFKTLTGTEFLILFQILLADGKLDDLLKGDVQLTSSSYIPSSAIHIPSVSLVTSFLQKIKNLPITYNDQKRIELNNYLDKLRNVLDAYNDELNKSYLPSLKVQSELSQRIPDLTIDILLTSIYLLEEVTEVEFASSNTTYIGLDGGLGYSLRLDNFFTYFGTNFYFKPVNKRVPLSQFKGWDRFFKMFSLYVGVTNTILGSGGTEDSPRYVSTLGNKKDILLGFGLRFNRAMRLNTGLQFYYLKDENPLINKKTLNTSLIASVTLDVNLISAFDKVGELLNIKP